MLETDCPGCFGVRCTSGVFSFFLRFFFFFWGFFFPIAQCSRYMLSRSRRPFDGRINALCHEFNSHVG